MGSQILSRRQTTNPAQFPAFMRHDAQVSLRMGQDARNRRRCRAYGVIVYEVGEITHADSWDEDRWNECSHGIHFFLTQEEAEAWRT